jgi:hypothetical protein
VTPSFYKIDNHSESVDSRLSFIHKHWLGQYPLSFSFWFIFIFLSLAFHTLGSFCIQQISSIHSIQLSALFFYQLTVGLLILPWQVTGLLRSAEHYFKNYGQPVILHSVQATVVIGLMTIMIHFVGQIQSLMFEKNWKDLHFNAAPKEYSIQWHEDEKQIILNGMLDFGVTSAVRSFLLTHPNAIGITIESKGGQVYEGRGLAALISQHKLNTYSFRYCLSACATAFIGGVERYLGIDGKLGFHQYAFDSKNQQSFQSFYNIEDEQEKDRTLYRSRNITENFIQQMFKSPNNEIWFPERKTLRQAGVIAAVTFQQR